MPNTVMATFGTRLYTRFSNLWVTPIKHKSESGAPSAANNWGIRDIVRAIIQRSPNQTSDMLQLIDENTNILAGFDNSGNVYGSGVTTVKDCISFVSISAANICDTGTGHLGNAAGTVLVADPAAGSFIELLSVVMSYTYATAAYTGGGNFTINSDGGSAITGLVSFANSLGAGSSNITQFVPLAAAAGYTLPSAKGLNLVASGAPTQPGTAAGTVKVYCNYRLYSSL